MDEYLSEVNRMLNLLNNSNADPQQRRFLYKVNEILTEEVIEDIVEFRNIMALYSDLDYQEGMNEFADLLLTKLDNYSMDYVRGVLFGLAFGLFAEQSSTPIFHLKPHHNKVLHFFDATRSFVIEKSSCL